MPHPKTGPLGLILALVLAILLIKAFALDAAVVEGPSMLPLLEPGQVVLVLRCAYGLRWPSASLYLIRWAEPRVGEVVAAKSPRDGAAVVKRVASSEGGRYFLLGDNAEESLDSRSYGGLPIESIKGKVLFLPRWAKR